MTCAHALFTFCLQTIKKWVFWTHYRQIAPCTGTIWIWALNAQFVWHRRSWMKEEVHVWIMLIIVISSIKSTANWWRKVPHVESGVVQGGLALHQSHLEPTWGEGALKHGALDMYVQAMGSSSCGALYLLEVVNGAIAGATGVSFLQNWAHRPQNMPILIS